MEKVNLTDDLVKSENCRVVNMTVYSNPPYFGFADSSIGISFCRVIKKGVKRDRCGRVKWYFGSANSLGKAIANANRIYHMKIKRKGWKKLKVKAFNLTEAGEIVELMTKKV